MIAVLVTTFDRPQALERSLPSIVRAAYGVGGQTLVVDDGSRGVALGKNRDIIGDLYAFESGALRYLHLPRNRGLVCALNVGLSYWLADPEVEAISYFQDDVEVDPLTIEVMEYLRDHYQYPLLTGRVALEHQEMAKLDLNGIRVLQKGLVAGIHLHAGRQFWSGVLPIPTWQPQAPKRIDGKRGYGAKEDSWICVDAPGSAEKLGWPVACVPGLVRTFCWKAEDSTWGNELKTGEEPPLSQEFIKEWIRLREENKKA